MMIRLPTETKDIGRALRDLRVMMGVQQQALIDAGVGTQSTISALENGHKVPLLHTVIAYLAVLDCQLGAVFADWKRCQCGRQVNKQGIWCCRMCRDTYGTHSSLCRRRNEKELPQFTTDTRGHIREQPAGE
jgi:DNA-binding XRE family transcriptional regulator